MEQFSHKMNSFCKTARKLAKVMFSLAGMLQNSLLLPEGSRAELCSEVRPGPQFQLASYGLYWPLSPYLKSSANNSHVAKLL